jgi:hypothetical protein
MFRRKHDGRKALAGIAARAKAELRRVQMKYTIARGWMDTECHVQFQGRGFACRTNGEVLCLDTDVVTCLEFSVGRRDRFFLLDRRIEMVIGQLRLPVFTHRPFKGIEIPSPDHWLSVEGNRQTIEALGIRHREILQVLRNGVTLCITPRDDEENWQLLERLGHVAEALPPPEEEGLADGEELINGLVFDPARLPEALQHLTPLIRKWSISDNFKRTDAEEAASAAELQQLVDAVSPHFSFIDSYLASLPEPYRNEAILLSTLAECAAEADLVLKERRRGG